MVAACLVIAASADAVGQQGVKRMVWHDASKLTVEGRGWNDTDGFYYRLPARAKSKVPSEVWRLASNSAGMVVRFVTDSAEIRLKWKLTSANLGMPHMPPSGVSGLDLYVRQDGRWRWLAIGWPLSLENQSAPIICPSPMKREFALYLPLYNGVSSVEIGIPDGATIEAAPARTMGTKPVVFYGTSITQGGCVSRPGMAYPSIIGRKLDAPIINLGFSGSGKCEHEVADLLAELDPRLFVIDCIPNMAYADVDERIRYLLAELRRKHPNTPVVLVEGVIGQNAFTRSLKPEKANGSNVILKKIYNDLSADWAGKLYYVKATTLLGRNDNEATVDGVHPTDLGSSRLADALTRTIERALQ
jgi:lysophospholipase L1-like esterase